jgi:hypothetical protein
VLPSSHALAGGELQVIPWQASAPPVPELVVAPPVPVVELVVAPPWPVVVPPP